MAYSYTRGRIWIWIIIWRDSLFIGLWLQLYHKNYYPGWSVPHLHPIILPTTGPMSFPGFMAHPAWGLEEGDPSPGWGRGVPQSWPGVPLFWSTPRKGPRTSHWGTPSEGTWDQLLDYPRLLRFHAGRLCFLHCTQKGTNGDLNGYCTIFSGRGSDSVSVYVNEPLEG